MKQTTATATHEGCAAACGADASLACIQTQAEDDLAAAVTWAAAPGQIEFPVWLGEHQWPIEPAVVFFWDINPWLPNSGQSGWGACSNGQRTNLTASKWFMFQPNNIMGGEDCVIRTQMGYGDSTCSLTYPCLC